MDISVNKPANDFLKRRFEAWYTKELSKQLHGNDIDTVELLPVNLRLAALKELGAKWLVGMADYISNNPQFIVNGFRRAGIPGALDGYEEDPEDLEKELQELTGNSEDKPEDPEKSENPYVLEDSDDIESETNPDITVLFSSDSEGQ